MIPSKISLPVLPPARSNANTIASLSPVEATAIALLFLEEMMNQLNRKAKQLHNLRKDIEYREMRLRWILTGLISGPIIGLIAIHWILTDIPEVKSFVERNGEARILCGSALAGVVITLTMGKVQQALEGNDGSGS